MTDIPEQDPPLTPEREAAVRRALGQAAGPEPMPAEVAARLNAVVAGLAAERADTVAAVADPATRPRSSRSVVVSMDPAARRRRTRARVVLAAAAVVVAAGVGGGLLRADDSAEDASARSVAEEPARGSSGSTGGGSAQQDTAAPESAADAVGGASSDTGDDQLSNKGVESRRVVSPGPVRTVRANALRADLVALQHSVLPARPRYDRATLAAPEGFACPGAGFGPGYLVGVEYDGQPALVAFRRPMGSTQVAEVLECGSGDVLHSTTLAAP